MTMSKYFYRINHGILVLIVIFLLSFCQCQDDDNDEGGFNFAGAWEQISTTIVTQRPIKPLHRGCKVDGTIVRPGNVYKMASKPCMKCICDPSTLSIKCDKTPCKKCTVTEQAVRLIGSCCPACKKKTRQPRPFFAEKRRTYTKEVTTPNSMKDCDKNKDSGKNDFMLFFAVGSDFKSQMKKKVIGSGGDKMKFWYKLIESVRSKDCVKIKDSSNC